MRDAADICDQKQDAYDAMSKGPGDALPYKECAECSGLHLCQRLGFPNGFEKALICGPETGEVTGMADEYWEWRCSRCGMVLPNSIPHCDCKEQNR